MWDKSQTLRLLNYSRRGFCWLILTAMLPARTSSQPAGRMVWGVVTDGQGRPVPGAVVKLKDMVTLHIRSFLTDSEGTYRFVGLHPETDYSLRARFKNHWSRRRMVTRFDSRESIRVDLPTGKRK